MLIDPEKSINFGSHEWRIIRAWIEQQRETKIRMLVGTDTHDKSQELRGAIKFIETMLSLEKTALMRANQNQGNVI